MSWSVEAVGKSEAVKKSLADQFTRAKTVTNWIPHENKSVTLIEQLVNNELDALSKNKAVVAMRVKAMGSATTHAGQVESTQVSLVVEPIFGFVE